MNSETKICQNCKKDFIIEPDDFVFYEKMKVPAPTFCPECRNQRRLSWRNERSLYKRKDNLTGEEIISVFSADKPFVVYGHKNWWSDKWDPTNYGAEYDFNRPFFVQFREFLERVPALALSNINPSNSDYCSFADGNKDCYLNFAAGFNERVSYSTRVGFCKDSLDLLGCSKNELCYDNVTCNDSYKLFFSQNCKNCTESYFLYNCRSCNNCVGCVNLVSKSYCIFNEPYTREDYEKKIKDMGISTREGLGAVRDEFNKILLKGIRRYANIVNSPNSTGENIYNSKSCKMCFDLLDKAEDGAYLFHSYDLRDNYDGMGMWRCELTYESVDANFNSRLLSCVTIYHSNDISYSVNCHASHDLFGCVGLRNKSYCVFNKQYSESEYRELVEKIKKQMDEMPYVDKKGITYKYGEFFPIEISPFAYNETIAQEYFPLTKDEVVKAGYLWKEDEVKNYKVTKNSKDFSANIEDISETISNEIIGCEHEGGCNEKCTVAFKIIPQELQLYKKMNIPLPTLCPNCRHYNRLSQRNPMRLWHRHCMKEGCTNDFETSYAPDRPEIVYCEQCYQQEVS
jgi:hypothetical protein